MSDFKEKLDNLKENVDDRIDDLKGDSDEKDTDLNDMENKAHEFKGKFDEKFNNWLVNIGEYRNWYILIDTYWEVRKAAECVLAKLLSELLFTYSFKILLNYPIVVEPIIKLWSDPCLDVIFPFESTVITFLWEIHPPVFFE